MTLGDPDDTARFGVVLKPPPLTWSEREGTRWAEMKSKTLAIDFFFVSPPDVTVEGPAGATPFVEARVRGGTAKTLSFSLNGHTLGGATVVRGETRIVSVKSSGAEPVAGQNELTLHVAGLVKGATGPTIEIDWIHFGVGEPDPSYSAATAEDTRVSRTIEGEPTRALSLRGPGFVRCEGWIPAGSLLLSRALLEGPGAADAEIRVIRDRVPPTVIGTLHLDARDGQNARQRSWPVGDITSQGFPGTLAAVELAVVRASKGARVLFGEPRVVVPPSKPGDAATKAPEPSAARGVVLVVMSELSARALSPYGSTLVTPATPSIASLAAHARVFDANRATTAVAGGALGSMLTGLAARDLGLTDGDSGLPRAVTTLADALRQAGVSTAFFTGNPLTSRAFGFDRGWSHFAAHLPTEDGSAVRAFDEASAWLKELHEGRFFLVVHARGGHPPWEVSLERIKSLPPENYTGGLEAKHAGELLARSWKTPGSYRFDDADRARAWALYGAALEDQDAAFGRLVEALKTAGVFDDTTVILTSDVGVNDAARVPFAESESLDEGALATPLIVHWAHDSATGEHVASPTTTEDIATTVLAAFGLPAPSTFEGRDLYALALGGTEAWSRALLATDQARFSMRWGSFVSSGVRDRETKLCDLSLEPACVTDVRESYPLASQILHATLFKDLVTEKPAFVREPAALDPATLEALKVWGR